MLPQKIKILFITRAYAGLPAEALAKVGGMERLSYEMIEAVSQDKRVSITTLAHKGSRITSPLFSIFIIPRALLAARKTDIVHLGDPMLSLSGWLIKKVWKRQISVTVHGLDISYANPFYQLYLRLFFRRLDTYLPISAYVNTLLNKQHVMGQRTIINPGINDQYYEPSLHRYDLIQALPALSNIKSADTILLTVGRLVKRKGHAWFIKNVLPQLPANYKYIIAGTGPEQNAIKAAASQSSVSNRVFILGKVSELQLKTLYNTANIFIQPNIKVSGDVEGFGLVLVEAALCGLPVYAAGIDGITDAIHQDKNGFLLPSASPNAWIKALTKNKVLFSSRQYTLANFSWEFIREKLLHAWFPGNRS